MSQTIENRIVEMQFENKQFESGVQESLSTLDKLKNALKFDDASKNLQDFSKNINKNIDLSGLSKSVEDVGSKFSASGIAGMEVIRRLTDFAIDAGKTIAHALDAPFAQIRQGGWKRAMNIEDAKFQLKGLGIAWETVSDSINEAVADTAFGLDAAAKACSQLSASGIQAGEDMTRALRGISGVAAMGNTEYENIAQIFTKAAGNGRVMADELNRISQYGLNARASVVKFFNDVNSGADDIEKKNIPEAVQKHVKAITKGSQMIESDLADMVKKGKLDFETFAYAMDYAFGEHAKAANETFMGSLRNIKAALSKIGAEFATPIIKGAVPVFNQIRIFLNDLRKQMGPVFAVFRNFTELVSGKVTKGLENFRHAFLDLGAIDHIGKALDNAFTNVLKIVSAIKSAFDAVFPTTRKFNRTIVDISESIERFSEKLVISDGVLLAFRNVMVVVFNVLKGIGTIIKNVLPIVGKVANVVLKITSAIVGLIGYLSTMVMQLDVVKTTMAAIQKAGGLFEYAINKIKDAFLKLRVILTDTTTVTGRFFLKLKEIATTGAYLVGGALYLAFLKIKEVLHYLGTSDPLGKLVDGAKSLLAKLKELTVVKTIVHGVEVIFGAVVLAINKAIEAVVKFVKEIKNGKSVFEALGSVASSVVSSIASGFSRLTDKIKSVISDFANGFTQKKIIEESFETPIANASLGLTGFVKEVSLTKKEVDSLDESITKGSSVLDSYQYQVKSSKTTLDKVKGSVSSFGKAVYDSVHNISASKVILTAWAGMLLVIAFNVNLLIKKLAGLAGTLSSGFWGLFRAMPTRFDKFKEGILMISAAIAVLAGSVYMLKDIPIDKLQEITKSLAILIGLAGGISLLATVLNTLFLKFSTGGNGFNFFSSNMFMLAAGIGAIVVSLKLLDTVKMDNIWKKVLVLGSIGAGLTAFSILMGKFAPQLSLGSIFMLSFAASILILVKALDNLSHVELDGIVANYHELGVIIVSFAGFAALAGTVGVSSILSMVAFILGLRTLLNSLDVIKDRLEEYHVGALLVKICKKLKEEIKSAVNYLKGIFDSLSEFDKKVVVAGIVAFTAGITAMLIGLSKAAKYLKKMAVSATILVASIAAVMFAVTKIAQICNSIPKPAMDKAITMLETVGLLFLAIMAISAIFGGDVDISWDKFGRKGLFKKNKIGSKKFKKSGQTEYLKQARKMMTDMAILLASVALFMNTVGKLTEDELARAMPVLIGTGVFALVLMSTVTAISANARSAGKASASLAAFIGIIAVIGTLLGSFVILMNYFKDFSLKDDWTQLALTVASMVGIVYAVHKLTKALNVGRQRSAYKSILAFAGMLAAIGLVVTYMTEHLKSASDLGKAAGIGVALVIFVGVISGMIIALEALSSKMFSTAKGNISAAKVKAFKTTMYAIVGMITATLLLAGTLCSAATSMTGFDVVKMGAIAAILVGVLASLSTIVLAIQHFTKDKLTSITKEGGPKLKQTLATIGMFFLAFEALAFTFSKMKYVDAGRMWGQASAISTTLIALTTLGLGLIYFTKKLKTDRGLIAKAGVILGGMIAAFEVLVLIFYQLSKINTEGIMGKAHAITLTLLELEALAVGMVGIGKLASNWAEIGAGGVAVAAMIGMFELLTLIFTQIDKLKVDGIMAKSQTIALTLLEMEALVMGVIGIGALLVGSGGLLALGAAGGMLALWGAIALFDMLTEVFKKIDGLKTEGIMKKSQTIVLVMLELELLGTMSVAAIPALIGALGLWPMISLFDLLTEAFLKIDKMKVDGLLPKAETIVLIMLELETVLSVCSMLSVAALIGAPGLTAMVGLFGTLSEVFLIIDQMHLDGLREKADIIVDTLLKLEGLSAIGGFIGTILGPGLLAFAAGIQAVGAACSTVGTGITTFSAGVERLVKTGPSIQAWFTNVSVGVATLAVTISTTVIGLSKSVVSAVHTLITGIIKEITAGGTMIFAAAVTLGNKMKQGFDSIVKPSNWGKELVNKLAAGINSGIPGIISAAYNVAKAIWTYLHFTEPEPVSPLHGCGQWMAHMMQMLGNSISSNTTLVLGPIGSLADGIKNTLGNLDLSSLGANAVSTLVNGLWSGSGDLLNWANWRDRLLAGGSTLTRMEQINQAVGKGATTRSQAVEKALANETKLKKSYDAQLAALEAQERGLKRSHASSAAAAKATENLRSRVEGSKKAWEDACKETEKAAGLYHEAADATTAFGNALADTGEKGKGAKDSTKEITDEIAEFYDKMEGAISLFDEFNKQTELTSDQLLKNMKSQIEGMTEWANNIQKLAFMGIDQGLLQQLADMGPQGYEYTNAFVHMTAEQLAEANNLYHQSLMLPAKVTSQIYGSYTVAGRSAASGFLMGMNKEDLKSSAVGFAHEVVDQMNEALDIVAGYSQLTAESGKAAAEGVKEGLQDPDTLTRLATAIKVLSDNDIKKKFDDGLINNRQMYTVGEHVTQGLANGINDKDAREAAGSAVDRLCGMIILRAEQAFQEKSPSRVFKKIGNFVTKGLGLGITEETQFALDAMGTTADSVIDTMRETINKANEALINDIDEPVIKPVLDLSDIQNGSRELDNMLSRNQALSASRSFNNLQNEQWNSQNALLNATMDNSDIVSAVTSLNEEVATLKDVMANIKVVLDTGTMVGAMTPAIDQQLGMRQVYAGRGI